MDSSASAWGALSSSFALELHIVNPDWPFPQQVGATEWRSLDDFFAVHADAACVLADINGTVKNSTLKTYDYVVLGPPEGWRGRYSEFDRWTYSPSPAGGYHALFVGHFAAHIGR